jgi:hypothetical protein
LSGILYSNKKFLVIIHTCYIHTCYVLVLLRTTMSYYVCTEHTAGTRELKINIFFLILNNTDEDETCV